MHVMHLLPGTGGTFYCENCVRDAGLVRTLRSHGCDVTMVPMYLPLLGEADNLPNAPVVFGAVNVWLQQQASPFRHAPRWMHRLLNTPWILRWIARNTGSVSARGQEKLTVSMLDGEDGNQARELDQLIGWMKTVEKPDVIQLATSLQLGLVRRIKQELGVPVVCSIQDEEQWVDSMDDAWRERVWTLIGQRAADADLLIAPSQWYADLMAARLKLPPGRIAVVHPGVNPGLTEPAPPPPVPVLGFLSRVTPSLGLDLIYDAFLLLRQDPRWANLRLHLTGGALPQDLAWMKKQRSRLKAAGALDAVQLFEDFSAPKRAEFMRGCTVVSVPAHAGMAFGLFMVEAMAAGRPVVLPKVGAYPEIVDSTGGGVIYEPNDAATLARTLDSVLGNPERAAKLGAAGREAARTRFSLDHMAREMNAIYAGLGRK